MGKYPGLSMWAQHNHKGLPNKKARDQRKRRRCDDESRETFEGALLLVSKREEGARNQ